MDNFLPFSDEAREMRVHLFYYFHNIIVVVLAVGEGGPDNPTQQDIDAEGHILEPLVRLFELGGHDARNLFVDIHGVSFSEFDNVFDQFAQPVG